MSYNKLKKNESLQKHGYKLKLGKFHRYTGEEKSKPFKGKKKIPVKKQIRDLERLISREGMPQEIVDAKKKELEELKFKHREKEIAIRKAYKYKTIKFHEKKKCLRRQKKAEKAIEEINKKIIPSDMTAEDFEKQKQEEIQEQQAILDQCEADLEYIKEYPLNKIYIGLYAEKELTPETKEKIQVMRNWIRQRKRARDNFRQREIQTADQEENQEVLDKIITKAATKNNLKDPFFVDSDAEVDDQEESKLVVDNRGKVIKVANEENSDIVRRRDAKFDDKFHKGRYRGDSKRSYYDANSKPIHKDRNFSRSKPPANNEKKSQPLHIKARSYRVSNVNLESEKKKVHLKF